MKMEMKASVNLKENDWVTGDNMAAERPQGAMELELTWRRPSGIIKLKGVVYYILNVILI
jgi:hypothetical protein